MRGLERGFLTGDRLIHDALFYASNGGYVAAVADFASEGLENGGSVLIAVPAPKLALLRTALARFADRVEFVDMMQSGRNPARIIPFIRGFLDAHRDRPVYFVGEPIWGTRSAAEIVEGVRHEALINEAFAHCRAHILCPYDERELAGSVLEDAKRTHPTILSDGERHSCAEYVDPLVVYAAADRPLSEPAAATVEVPLTEGLARFRAIVEAHARTAGAAGDRVRSFVIAANEAAANTLTHAHGRGSARLWREDRELIFEIADSGVIDDPLVGRCAPPAEQNGGRGVWMINQLCDLAEVRSGPAGTVVRLHLQLS